jgi:hypothetical protein
MLSRHSYNSVKICTWCTRIELCCKGGHFKINQMAKRLCWRSSSLNATHFPKHRSYMTKLRIESHNLRVETGRHNGLAKEDRLCQYCTSNWGKLKMSNISFSGVQLTIHWEAYFLIHPCAVMKFLTITKLFGIRIKPQLILFIPFSKKGKPWVRLNNRYLFESPTVHLCIYTCI